MNSTPANSQPVPPSPRVLPATLPTKLAVISPLITTGPVTYESLLADLNDSPIPYQLWLLAQVSSTAAPAQGQAAPAQGQVAPAASLPSSPSINPAHSDWAVAPNFSPVSGVDATSVAWPNTETPRVITVQYSGLEINQAVNWAIRQAHGDMILVLDHGLSGLLQLRQALDEIRSEIQRSVPVPPAATATIGSLEVSQPTQAQSESLGQIEDHPLPGALNRRLVERLEQWGVAMQRQAARSRQQREAAQPIQQQAQRSRQPIAPIPNLSPAEIAAVEALEALSETINRIDEESIPQPKKLPKFITHFHEFI